MEKTEIRKQKEAEFHNKVRDERLRTNKEEYTKLTLNKKFYYITRKNREFVNNLLLKNKDEKVLDYCCGNGDFTIFLAKNGVESVGIDISDISIQNAKNAALREGVEQRASFFVRDAEATQFLENSFDIITCLGVLHHLDTKKAFQELSRILKPNGRVVCNEPLIYNPIFQLYRKMTPSLRTKWETEHILSKKDIELANNYFGNIEIHFFHLATLFAVPFRNLSGFSFLLGVLEKIDSIILKLPFLKWWAWQIVFILSDPKKP